MCQTREVEVVFLRPVGVLSGWPKIVWAGRHSHCVTQKWSRLGNCLEATWVVVWGMNTGYQSWNMCPLLPASDWFAHVLCLELVILWASIFPLCWISPHVAHAAILNFLYSLKRKAQNPCTENYVFYFIIVFLMFLYPRVGAVWYHSWSAYCMTPIFLLLLYSFFIIYSFCFVLLSVAICECGH